MPNEMSDTLRQTALISAADPEFPDLLRNGRPRGRRRHRGPHRSTRQPVRQWHSWDQGCGLVGLASSWPPPTCDTCWPELRPREQVGIPATPSPKFCESRPRKNGHSNHLQPGTPAARNDDWAPTVMTTAAASGRSLEGSASTTSVSERRTHVAPRWHQVVATDLATLPPLRRVWDPPVLTWVRLLPWPRERGGRWRA